MRPAPAADRQHPSLPASARVASSRLRMAVSRDPQLARQYDEQVKFSLFLLLGALSCSRAPKELVDPKLAVYMPEGATVVAGVDLDRLRGSPLFAKIPQPFREGSYTLVGYDGKELVTASRAGSRVTV